MVTEGRIYTLKALDRSVTVVVVVVVVVVAVVVLITITAMKCLKGFGDCAHQCMEF